MKARLIIQIFFAVFSMMLLLSAAHANSTNTLSTQDTVTVVGEGFIDAEPDVVDLHFQLYAVKPNLKNAKSSVDVLYRKALMVIKQYKVDDKDIKLTQMSSYKEYEWNNQKRTFKGHRLSRNLHITVREKEIYPELLQGLVDAGISAVSNVHARISNKEKVKENALVKAIDSAKYKASLIAQQFDRQLGSVIYVAEGQMHTTPPNIVVSKARSQGVQESFAAPQEQFGTERIWVKVTVTFRLI